MGDGATIGYHPTKEPSYEVVDPNKLIGTLFDFGVSNPEGVAASTSKLKKLIKNAKREAEDGDPKFLTALLDGCVRPVIKTMFGERKR